MQAPELSAASGSASASDLGGRVSDFNLDDLLGLGSPEPPSPAPSATPGTPAAPAAEDPFQARHCLNPKPSVAKFLDRRRAS